MFISLSKTLARFGGVRIGIGTRLSKKNAPGAIAFLFVMWFFQLMWYMLILSFWIMYAVLYGCVWLYSKMFKTSIPLFKKLFDKIAEEYNKKEGNQA